MHAGVKLLLAREAPTQQSTTPDPNKHAWINKERATLCADCPAIYDAANKQCPSCASKHGWPLARWIDRETSGVEEQT